MQDLNDKITGNSLSASEWNEVPSEIQNVIEGLGITLSGGDLNQLGKAIAGYAANGDFYTDSGAADAYVLAKIGLKQTPPEYTNGMRVRFNPGNTSTGSSTVNVAGLGVKNITATSTAGIIISGKIIELVYNSGSGEFEIVPRAFLSEEFISSEQTITAAGSLTIAHGLSASPKLMQARLICKIAEGNYSINDEVMIGIDQQGDSVSIGLSVVPDATNLNMRYGSNAVVFNLLNKTTGTGFGLTLANWRMIVRAWT